MAIHQSKVSLYSNLESQIVEFTPTLIPLIIDVQPDIEIRTYMIYQVYLGQVSHFYSRSWIFQPS